MNVRLGASIAALWLALSAQASACEGPKVLFADDFSTADPAWGNYSDLRIDNGALTLLVNPGNGYPLYKQGSLFSGDYEVCVSVVQRNTDPSVAWASMLFWAADYDNYYLFQAATNGHVNVARRKDGAWQNPVGWIRTGKTVKPGASPNRLRVVIKGNRMTGYVNGKKVLSFTGEPPDGGSLVGVYGNAPNDTPASYDFDDFKVTEAD